MKKLASLLGGALLTGSLSYAQPVNDRAVIPLAVTLNQVMRLHVVEGGNIEFVFNTIQDYKDGIAGTANDPFYTTDIEIASSVDWDLAYGSEAAALEATDDDAHAAPAFNNENIGWQVAATGGGYGIGAAAENLSAPTTNGTVVADLDLFGVANMLENNPAHATGNAGDKTDNAYTITWYCGTQTGDMLGTSILDGDFIPDRYYTNVLLDLNIDP